MMDNAPKSGFKGKAAAAIVATSMFFGVLACSFPDLADVFAKISMSCNGSLALLTGARALQQYGYSQNYRPDPRNEGL